MNYSDALTWLYGTQTHGVKLGLNNIRRLLRAMDVHVDGQGEPWYVHVAGTNGKGSVCAMLDSILRAAGKRTGLYTSPHLIDFRERMRHNGKMIAMPEIAARLSQIREVVSEWEHCPTFFEITTAVALGWFQDMGTEVAILETGMGGRLDATNAVTPAVSVLTHIYFDHEKWLGETLPEIALEKAGIIKPGIPVIAAWQRDEVLGILGHVALHRNCPFHIVVSPLGGVEIGLAGRHQRWNAAVAVHALQLTRLRVSDEAIIRGLRDVHWPGRFQKIGSNVVLDGAHNPAGARTLVETWKDTFGDQKATIILGCMADKNLAGICDVLGAIATRAVMVPVRSDRSATGEELSAVWKTAHPEIPVETAVDLQSAIDLAGKHTEPMVIAGSLFLVGEALAHFENKTPPPPTSQ